MCSKKELNNIFSASLVQNENSLDAFFSEEGKELSAPYTWFSVLDMGRNISDDAMER
jgi:hypothetical protein